MRRISMILGLSLLLVPACGDDDDGDHGHDAESGSGGTRGGSSGRAGGATAGRAGSQATAGRGTGGSAGKSATGGKGSADDGDEDVTIRFKGKVGSEDFACGRNYDGLGSQSSTVTPRDFRFFVQDIKLLDGDREVPVKLKVRGPWQSDSVALVDFEDGSGACADGNPDTNTVIEGTVPKGTYTGIVFSNSVPDALNHGDPVTLPDPLKTYASMSWGWLFGFRFLIAETVLTGLPDDVDAGAEVPAAWLHLGAGGCTNDAAEDAGLDFEAPPITCARPSINRIQLGDYKVGESVIVADLAKVFAESDLRQTQGCHGSGDACTPLWRAVGLDTEGKALDTQRVYSLE